MKANATRIHNVLTNHAMSVTPAIREMRTQIYRLEPHHVQKLSSLYALACEALTGGHPAIASSWEKLLAAVIIGLATVWDARRGPGLTVIGVAYGHHDGNTFKLYPNLGGEHWKFARDEWVWFIRGLETDVLAHYPDSAIDMVLTAGGAETVGELAGYIVNGDRYQRPARPQA